MSDPKSIAVSADPKRYAGRGRRRQEGERYASGGLKPRGPNEEVERTRRERMGAAPEDKVDLSRAENALDLALTMGWLLPHRHMAARRYAGMMRRKLAIPSVRTSSGVSSAYAEAKGEK